MSTLIKLIPNHHSSITRCNAHHRFRVDCVIRWNQTWKRKPLPTMLGKWRDGVTHCSAPPYCWNGWRAADWVAQGSSPLKAVKGAAIQCIHDMGPWASPGCTYVCHGYAPKGCCNANASGWSSIGEHCIQNGTWKQKAYTIIDTNMYKQINGRFNSEKETYLQRSLGITGICLRRHLGLRLLLQHSGEANNTLCPLGISSSSSRTTSCDLMSLVAPSRWEPL